MFAWLVGLGVRSQDYVCGSSSQTIAMPEDLDFGAKQDCVFILGCLCSLSKRECVLLSGLVSFHFHYPNPWHLKGKRV